MRVIVAILSALMLACTIGAAAQTQPPPAENTAETTAPSAAPAPAAGTPTPAQPNPAAQPQPAQQPASKAPVKVQRISDMSRMQQILPRLSAIVEMSKLVHDRAAHPELVKFANSVATKQDRRISVYSSFLHERDCARASCAISEADKTEFGKLKALYGKEFEIAYMQSIIAREQETIQLSLDTQQGASRQETRETAANTVKDQTANIQQLRTWLSAWYGVNTQ